MRSLFVIAGVALALSAQAAELKFVRASADIFKEPHDIVIDSEGKRLFIADMMNGTVKIVDPATLAVLGEFGEGELSYPHDVSIDQHGKLLVADTGNDRIAIYDIQSATPNRIGELHDSVSGPEGVGADSNGRVYVTNTADHTVMLLEHGRLLKIVGQYGHKPGEFIQPHDIEVGSDGKVYVGDPGNNRIQVLRRDLSVEKQIVGDGRPFSRPKYLCVDEELRLYVADQDNSAVRVLDSQGHQIAEVSEAAGKKLDRPEGVLARGKQVWVADTYNDRIILFEWK